MTGVVGWKCRNTLLRRQKARIDRIGHLQLFWISGTYVRQLFCLLLDWIWKVFSRFLFQCYKKLEFTSTLVFGRVVVVSSHVWRKIRLTNRNCQFPKFTFFPFSKQSKYKCLSRNMLFFPRKPTPTYFAIISWEWRKFAIQNWYAKKGLHVFGPPCV